jgi:hypothetical protein
MKKVAIVLSLIVSVSATQLKVPSAYSTIQAGLNAASSGDTVLVAAGTYTENIIWPDVNGIKLISAGDSSNTIIDGSGTSSVIYMNPSSATIDTTTLIQGFKITNGGGVSNGGGMSIIGGSSPLLSNLRVSNNQADISGGGFYINASSPKIINTSFEENIGGVSGGAISFWNNSAAKLSGIQVVLNSAIYGGGFYLDNSDPTISSITISNNSSQYDGGGLFITTNSSPTVTDFIIRANTATAGKGGGIMIHSGNTTLESGQISNNIASGSGGGLCSNGGGSSLTDITVSFNQGGSGGGVNILKGSPVLDDVRIHNNAAGEGGGMMVGEVTIFDVTNVVIFNNSAKIQGGGLSIFNSNFTINNLTIMNNTAEAGGAISVFNGYGGRPTFSRIMISNNHTTGENGAIYIEMGSPIIISSNIVNNGTAIFNKDNSTLVDATNNFWGHTSGPYHVSQNSGGQGDSTNAFVTVDPWLTAPDTDAPPIPAQNLKLDSQTVTSATFTWDASKIGDLAGYKFYYDTDSSGYPYANSVDLGNVVTKSLTGLTAGKTYYVAVSTYDTDGNESWYSKEVSVTMNNTPVIAAVSDVTINEDESSTVTLSATDVEGDAITYSAVSDTNAVTVSVSSSTLTLTPNANWHGVANIKVYASDGYSKDSTSFKLTVTPVDDISAVQDMTIDEDKSAEVTLTSTFSGTTTFTAVSDTNAVTTSVSSSALTLTPTANWHGVANIKAYASDGTSKDSTSFTLTVTSVNDAPTAFEWVSSALDTINITQSNLAETYTLQWDASTDVDGDSIDYLVSAKIGVYPSELIYDTTVTTLPLSYQEIVENVFEGMPNERATVRFSVSATDGIDTVKVTGDDRVLFVNRYDYLSTEGEGIPTEFALHENYPNPFNPTTTLRFDLPEVSNLTLTIYNMLGQKVRTFNYQNTSAGYHSVKWNATNDYGDPVGAGVYLYQLQTKDFVKTRKMVLLK